jgi:hypothetical protein
MSTRRQRGDLLVVSALMQSSIMELAAHFTRKGLLIVLALGFSFSVEASTVFKINQIVIKKKSTISTNTLIVTVQPPYIRTETWDDKTLVFVQVDDRNLDVLRYINVPAKTYHEIKLNDPRVIAIRKQQSRNSNTSVRPSKVIPPANLGWPCKSIELLEYSNKTADLCMTDAAEFGLSTSLMNFLLGTPWVLKSNSTGKTLQGVVWRRSRLPGSDTVAEESVVQIQSHKPDLPAFWFAPPQGFKKSVFKLKNSRSTNH